MKSNKTIAIVGTGVGLTTTELQNVFEIVEKAEKDILIVTPEQAKELTDRINNPPILSYAAPPVIPYGFDGKDGKAARRARRAKERKRNKNKKR